VGGAPKALTDKLQRVLNTAARVTSDTDKFDRGLTQLLHEKLHWYDVRDRVTLNLVVMVHQCLHELSGIAVPLCSLSPRAVGRSRRRRS